MEAKLFVIEALSSMHVGNGEINYGLIDNLIQRDPVTEMPIINSSSLKGALREYFKHLKESKKDTKWTVAKIFGSDPKDNTNRKQGSVRFFEAELLAIPVRCNDKPYKMVTSEDTVKGLKAKLESFCMTIDKEKIDELFNDIERITHPEFKELCSDDELPVISRNNLESGQSTNLWYEQVLPKHSLLGFVVMGDESETFKAFCEELDKAKVQIGANATIGYGFCKISEVC